MTKPKKEIKSKIFEIFKITMLSPDEVVEMALRDTISAKPTQELIKKDFSSLVETLQKTAYETYLYVQAKSGRAAITEYFKDSITLGMSPKQILEVIAASFVELDKFYLSLGQSRKARAGGAFEDIIRTLFKMLSYPFQEQIVINGKPDFLMPDETHYRNNPMDCIIFTAKRTLRERWRQIVTEGTRGLGFFLATIDEKISEAQLTEMKNNRIYLVVPRSLKDAIPHYSKAINVITFEAFFLNHLDPAVKRWKRAGII